MSMFTSIAASWTGRIGLAGLAVGAVLLAYGSWNALPARAALKTAAGPVTEAVQYTRTSVRRSIQTVTSVDFMLTIGVPGAAAPVKLSIPSTEITRVQVASLINQQVKAEYDSEGDVYALSSQGLDVITYETTLAARTSAIQKWAERGKVFIALGVPLILVGWPLGARKRRKQQAAGNAVPVEGQA
ncbi:hypothetical protein E8L99_12905 [Phreatobacter aquaticus]|uniref:Uncharacterized protein n=1 Tax=Phreatobacter aquaticus TaxID=2570229 RepID=A0A4D7QIW7_9HYPH|nr:hypothetical protein [Phreatobacter aquaticus]QCK86591.1 hypothetical protein E8L99_12905 [Phreatobacter aquaticus]